jgi:hypothetical protein
MWPPLRYSVALAAAVFRVVLNSNSRLAANQLIGTYFCNRIHFLAAYRSKHPREL